MPDRDQAPLQTQCRRVRKVTGVVDVESLMEMNIVDPSTRASRFAQALEVASVARKKLVELKRQGQSGAGIEAMLNGALICARRLAA